MPPVQAADRPPCPPRLNPTVLEGRWVRLEPLAAEHAHSLSVLAEEGPAVRAGLEARLGNT